MTGTAFIGPHVSCTCDLALMIRTWPGTEPMRAKGLKKADESNVIIILYNKYSVIYKVDILHITAIDYGSSSCNYFFKTIRNDSVTYRQRSVLQIHSASIHLIDGGCNFTVASWNNPPSDYWESRCRVDIWCIWDLEFCKCPESRAVGSMYAIFTWATYDFKPFLPF